MSLGDRIKSKLDQVSADREAAREKAVKDMAEHQKKASESTLGALKHVLSDNVLEAIIDAHSQRQEYRRTHIGIETGKYGVYPMRGPGTQSLREWSEDFTLDPFIAIKLFSAPEIQQRVEELKKEGIEVSVLGDEFPRDGKLFILVDFTKVR